MKIFSFFGSSSSGKTTIISNIISELSGSIRKFMDEYSMLYIEGDQERLKSINTEEDLIDARKNLRCP